MTKNARGSVLAAVLVLVVAFLLVTAARAQSVADFYRGKSIDLNIGYSVGGGYDLYARLIARRLGAHIPGNPTIVSKNMEGAGSLRLANYLYAAAASDGTVIGATSRGPRQAPSETPHSRPMWWPRQSPARCAKARQSRSAYWRRQTRQWRE